MPEVAIDATGMESSTASAHYQARSGRKRHQYVKLSLAITCTTILAVALVVSWGPTNDKTQARELLARASEKVKPSWLFADDRGATTPSGCIRRAGSAGACGA